MTPDSRLQTLCNNIQRNEKQNFMKNDQKTTIESERLTPELKHKRELKNADVQTIPIYLRRI